MKKSVSYEGFIKWSLFFVFVLVVFLYLDNIPSIPVTGYATSQNGNLTATISTYISCTWTNAALNISFGLNLNPSDTDVNATQNFGTYSNGTSYNATVDTLTNVNVNFTVAGSNLVSGTNIIGIGNVTWQSNTTANNGTNMLGTNSIILSASQNTTNPVGGNLAAGSSTHFRFWLDVPAAQTAGAYSGNYTMQCIQAT